ncbi:MAG: hypothetical protein KIT80_20970 [Chitinophagaceae bacterium]|nr:hypothetical protein [Chitinophagaceae bacterium]MCW5929406.1 hypothetical protein [Chitinophagaceae bacterium]
MFYLKNDDMEELFRKAAESYEVDTSGASNWDAVHKSLHKPGDSEKEEKGRNKKKRRVFLWWLLLLPAGWIIYSAGKKTEAGSAHTLVQYEQAGQTNGNRHIDRKAHNSIQDMRAAGKDHYALPAKDDTGGRKKHNATDGSAGKEYPGGIRKGAANDKTDNRGSSHSIPGGQNKETVTGEEDPKRYDGRKAGREKPTGGTTDEAVQSISGSIQRIFREDRNNLYPDAFQGRLVTAGATSRPLNITDNDSAFQSKEIEGIRQRYFYATALLAPDLSSVRLQRISGTGSSMGLLIGYKTGKRWHFETGAFWERKTYYTKGQYFDKSKLSDYYRNVEMLFVDGSCRMITIPVNARYNVYAGDRKNWFVSSGVSSYLINQEYYEYTYRRPGGEPATRGYKYTKAAQNWMTVINISVGYEQTFRSFNIRAEPYLRIPASGVGVGNLSLNSGGLYIGIGKNF